MSPLSVNRIAFCTRCMQDGVEPEKQFLLGRDICFTCGSKIFCPEQLELPALVQRTTRKLVETFMFRLDNVDPRYQHQTPGGSMPMRRLYFSNRMLKGFACIISWYDCPGFTKEHLPKGASWQSWTDGDRSLKLKLPELVDTVARDLNKKFEITSSTPLGPRMSRRFQGVDGETSVLLELSWEQLGEPRFRVLIREPAQEAISVPIRILTHPLMTAHEAAQVADHCGRSIAGKVRIDIEDVTLGVITHSFKFHDRQPTG